MTTKTVGAALLLALLATAASAGPVFETIGVSPLTDAHPSGTGTRAASHSWGISTTGGGFIDGRIVFSDDFLLPASPGDAVSFDETDLLSLEFEHLVSAFAGGGAIVPTFSFSVGTGEFSDATGAIAFEGTVSDPVYRMTSVSISTSVSDSAFVFLPAGAGGIYTGTWAFSGIAPFLEDATRFAGDVPRDVGMIVDSQYQGRWLLTGFENAPVPAPVPEPGSLTLFGLGVLALGAVVRRRAARGRTGGDPRAP